MPQRANWGGEHQSPEGILKAAAQPHRPACPQVSHRIRLNTPRHSRAQSVSSIFVTRSMKKPQANGRGLFVVQTSCDPHASHASRPTEPQLTSRSTCPDEPEPAHWKYGPRRDNRASGLPTRPGKEEEPVSKLAGSREGSRLTCHQVRSSVFRRRSPCAVRQ